MINRVLIRLKVLQILYSVYKGMRIGCENEEAGAESKNVAEATKTLLFSLDKTYDLYLYLLSLIVLLTDKAKKNLAHAKGERGLVRMSDNKFAAQLSANVKLKNFIETHDMEVLKPAIKDLFDAIKESEAYSTYSSSSDETYDADKEFWRQIFKTVISDSDSLGHELEELSIFWNDDAEVVVSFVIKTIKQCEETDGEDCNFMPMFKDEEDKRYACDLLKYAIEGECEYKELISAHSKNWENDRIAFMDILIMQVALAEIIHFPSIPVSVSINEYLEIAKAYSTEKSSNFINGVLDSVVETLRSENKLLKAAQFTKNFSN